MRAIFALAAVLAFSAAAYAGGDPKNGEILFGRCAMCHSIAKGGANGMGPNLFGVYGRKAATLPGFAYSPALKKYAKNWDDAALQAWLANPQKEVPGTRMVFIGFPAPNQRDDIIAYLKTKK